MTPNILRCKVKPILIIWSHGNFKLRYLRIIFCCFFIAFWPPVPKVILMFFFYLGFLSRTSVIQRTTREGGGYFFNFSLQLLPLHKRVEICRAITPESSPQHKASNQIRIGNLWLLTCNTRFAKRVAYWLATCAWKPKVPG